MTAEHAPGTLVAGRYRLEKLLGRGGMGEVWHARHLALNTDLAIKFLLGATTSDAARKRFLTEARVTAQLKTRHAAQVFDFGVTDEGHPFLAMELIEGESLGGRLARVSMTREQVTSVIRQIARALERAHSLGIVHRDLKPDNVLLTRDEDGNEQVKVVDFGIAKLVGDLDDAATAPTLSGAEPTLDPRALESFTKTGAILGTPSYMAPEQITAARDVGPAADIWALGVVAYRCLTGHSPFGATTLPELFGEIQQRQYRPARTFAPDLPSAFDAWFERACAVDPRARFASASEAGVALATALSVAVSSVSLRESGPLKVVVGPKRLGSDADAMLHTLESGDAATRTSSRRVRRTALLASAAAISLVAAGVVFALAQRGDGAPPSVPSATASAPPRLEGAVIKVLIADFENKTGEPLLDGTLEPVVVTTLEEASTVTSFNRSQAKRIASELSPGATSVDSHIAGLVAVHEHLDVVIDGTVEASDGELKLALRAVAPDGRVIAAPPARHTDKQHVLEVTASLAGELRAALGGHRVGAPRDPGNEIFATPSLEAAHEYKVGKDFNISGKYDEAIKAYLRAIEIDPHFGGAYSSLASNYANLGKPDLAEKYFKLAMANIDRMTEREKHRMRSLYFLTVRDAEKAIEELTSFVAAYPNDLAGRNNLAVAYEYHRDFERARAEGVKAVEMTAGTHLPARINAAMYAIYGGQFELGRDEELKILTEAPKDVTAHVAVALASFALGDMARVREMYGQVAKLGAWGATVSTLATADLAVHDGQAAAARQLLEPAIAADEKAGDIEAAARKAAILADAWLELGQPKSAIAAADKAARSTTAEIMFSAGRAYVAAGELKKARVLSATLGQRAQADPQMYHLLLDAEIAIATGDSRSAIRIARDAIKTADAWIAHFDLARAYLESNAFLEAHKELELCGRRRGEALALYLDEVPTLRVMAPLHYYLARSLAGLGSPGAHVEFEAFLALREHAPKDPLAIDARRRLAAH